MKIALLILAIVLFVLQGCGVPLGQFAPGWFGLAVGFGALAIPSSRDGRW